MTPEQALATLPHLISPAHLAQADTNGKWIPAPHLKVMNKALVGAWRSPNSRTAINVPFPAREELARQYLLSGVGTTEVA